jgi:hypothetical protein
MEGLDIWTAFFSLHFYITYLQVIQLLQPNSWCHPILQHNLETSKTVKEQIALILESRWMVIYGVHSHLVQFQTNGMK